MCDGAGETELKSTYILNGVLFSILRCKKDDLMFPSPQPGDPYTRTLYSHPTYFAGTDDMYGMLVEDEKSSAIAKIRVDEILKYRPNAKSLFEVGAAKGHTLVAA